MKYHKLSKLDNQLVDEAKALLKKRLSKQNDAAAVLRTTDNKIFQGVCLDIKCSPPCSVCAEYTAIGAMVTGGSKKIDTIVAVGYWNKDGHVMSPCGKCRQLIGEFGDPYVIVEVKKQLKKVRLSELMPLAFGSK